jgi:hypothetical protein
MVCFQAKDSKKYCMLQALGGLCFFLNFLLLEDYTASILNIIFIFQSAGFVMISGKKNTGIFAIVMVVLYSLTLLLTYDGIFSVLIYIAQLACVIAMYTANAMVIRYFQIGISSPLWLINNIATRSVGGVVCEIFSLCSAVVFVIRMKIKDKKEVS